MTVPTMWAAVTVMLAIATITATAAGQIYAYGDAPFLGNASSTSYF